MNWIQTLLTLTLTLMLGSHAWAAACCGGGASFPSVIAGDFKSQLSMSTTYGRVIGDVSPSGESVFRRDSNKEDTKTLKLDYALQFRELWQIAVAAPFIEKERTLRDQNAYSNGVGDVSASVSYEFLPEYSYTEWKPRGFVYFRTSLPTSPSIYDFQNTMATDARGSGFVSHAIGTLLMKSRGSWDFQVGAEVSKGWTRTFDSRENAPTVTPGTGAAILLAAGYSPPKISEWRFGCAVTPRYMGPKVITSAGTSSQSSEEWVWDTSLNVNYLIEKEWMAGLSYLDQTFLGPAQNTTLTRSVSLLLQKRWSL